MDHRLDAYLDQQDADHIEHEIGQGLLRLGKSIDVDHWWRQLNRGFPLLSRREVLAKIEQKILSVEMVEDVEVRTVDELPI